MAKTVDNTQATKNLPTPKVRRGMKGYWTEVIRELKKVDWPPVKEVNRLTGVVLAVCGLIIAILWGFAYVSSTVVNLIQGKQ